ncbi:MAG: FAD:protein FMN transferase [Deltaproteobacteria bacterium]|nr:FAD:protein FMN transferase [Deltaproteobacteria bacterium]
MKLGKKPRLLIFFTLCLSGCSLTQVFSRTQMLMGDVPVSIQIRAPFYQKEKAFEAMEEAYKVARGLETELSEFKIVSDTSRLNNGKAGETIPVGAALFNLLKTAEKISRETNGAFDVTYASPRGISFHDLEIKDSGRMVYLKKSGIKIGVSGIAKGYIVDQMSDSLIQQGFKDHLVNAGGDLGAHGVWEVGIRDPRREGFSLCTMTLEDQSASTSGLYERGEHIMDPRTKKRVKRNDLLSATVIGPSTLETDPLATAAFVLSSPEIEELFSQSSQIALFLVGADKKVRKIGLSSLECQP